MARPNAPPIRQPSSGRDHASAAAASAAAGIPVAQGLTTFRRDEFPRGQLHMFVDLTAVAL